MGDYSDLKPGKLFASVNALRAVHAFERGLRQSVLLVALVLGAALSAGAAPANDNFAGATAITGLSGATSGSTVGATKEPGEPNHGGNGGGASVWFRWVAPANGTVTFNTAGSAFDTLLGVYTGSSVGSLVAVAANDDGPNMGTASLDSFFATGGTAYQIAVDGYNAAAGNIVLSVYPGTASQLIYYTGFDAIEGYSTFFTLAGQSGWTSFGAGQNGVVYNYFSDFSQQAYLGVSSASPGSSLFVWKPLNYTPNTNTLPNVVF